MKKLLKGILKSLGYQLNKYHEEDKMKMLRQFGINKLFDVGANIGQYGQEVRRIGYDKKIISFEPMKAAYNVLEQASAKDNNWVINNCALGNENMESEINVAGNSYSSSILNMLPEHENRAPESKYVAKEKIEIKTLDSIFNNYYEQGDNIMLKIDTQGFEKNVILGSEKVLDKITLMQLEMSVVALYENETSFIEMIRFLDSKGFELFSLENGFSDERTGRLLQLDGLFVNKKIGKKF